MGFIRIGLVLGLGLELGLVLGLIILETLCPVLLRAQHYSMLRVGVEFQGDTFFNEF